MCPDKSVRVTIYGDAPLPQDRPGHRDSEESHASAHASQHKESKHMNAVIGRALVDYDYLTRISNFVGVDLATSVATKVFKKGHLITDRPFDLQQLSEIWQPDDSCDGIYTVALDLGLSSFPSKLLFVPRDRFANTFLAFGMTAPVSLVGLSQLFRGTNYGFKFWKSRSQVRVRWKRFREVEGTSHLHRQNGREIVEGKLPIIQSHDCGV